MMKKIIIICTVVLITVMSIFVLDDHFDDGLTHEIRLFFTPDIMSHNTYDAGECTYYVFDRIRDDGNQIERSWRDAEKWAVNAEEDEYVVNSVPKEGAILQTEAGPIGHVAYIETVHADGSIDISEMNLYEPYEITERTIDTDDIDKYKYIHPEKNPHAEKYIEASF